MTEKGCDNCYYTYFDERAYPCSLCIRGIERTDQWQPSKKTKAEAQTDEPTWEQVKEYCNKRCLDIVDSALRKKWYKDEPQMVISYTSGNNSYGEQIQTDHTDCSWK